jgi:hypothetical protein
VLEPAMRETTAGAQIVVSTEAVDEARAAAEMRAVLADALDAAGCGHLQRGTTRFEVTSGGPPPF